MGLDSAPTTRSRSAAKTPIARSSAAQAHELDKTVSERDVSQDRVDRGRPRSGLEIPRKLLHSSIAPLVTYIWISHPNVRATIHAMFICLVVVAGADFVRFQSPAFESTYERYLGYFMRESERVNYYLVGILICLTFYPRDIACLCVVILSLCDTSASVFGRIFGRYTPPLPFSGTLFGAKKSLAGTLAAVLTGTLTSYIWWSQYSSLGDEGDLSWVPGRIASGWKGPFGGADPTFFPRLPNPESTLSLEALSVMCGVVAGVAEAFDIWGLDDNLTLPVLFGFGAWLSMWILG